MTNQTLIDQIIEPSSTDMVCFPVVETFHSLQGEGAWAGVNAFFIRLGGCDVGCPWCDTKESWNRDRHPQLSVAQLTQAAKAANPTIVVVTGGEPTMHDLEPLTRALHSAGLRVHLETSGAHPLSGDFDWITLLPSSLRHLYPVFMTRFRNSKL